MLGDDGSDMTWPTHVDDLKAADVVHRHLSTLPGDSTVADLTAYFATSSSRRLAVLADGPQFIGSIEPDDLNEAGNPSAPAVAYASRDRVIDPEAPATAARELALAEASRRLPVVDRTGQLVGVVAITRDLDGFCGYLEPSGRT